MARSKRTSVPSGYYEITTLTANGEKLLADDCFKDEIVKKLYGTAAFSGVKLLAWCICDDGFKLVIHVPDVPRHYYPDENIVPAAHAFGMRPVENRPQLWMPPQWDYTKPIPQPPRPEVGYMIPDEEMLRRLEELYQDPKRIETKRISWAKSRAAGRSEDVVAEKLRFCKRMYNLSQFMKSFNEWLAEEVNRRTKHVGHVFARRFDSIPVDTDQNALQTAALDTDYEPYRSGLVSENEFYRWSSLGQAACGGSYSMESQRAYISIWGNSFATHNNMHESISGDVKLINANDPTCSKHDIELSGIKASTSGSQGIKLKCDHETTSGSQGIKLKCDHETTSGSQGIELKSERETTSGSQGIKLKCERETTSGSQLSFEIKWDNVREIIVSQLREQIEHIENLEERLSSGNIQISPAQVVKSDLIRRMHVHYIGSDPNFIDRLKSQMEFGYPIASPKSYYEFIKIVQWSSPCAY